MTTLANICRLLYKLMHVLVAIYITLSIGCLAANQIVICNFTASNFTHWLHATLTLWGHYIWVAVLQARLSRAHFSMWTKSLLQGVCYMISVHWILLNHAYTKAAQMWWSHRISAALNQCVKLEVAKSQMAIRLQQEDLLSHYKCYVWWLKYTSIWLVGCKCYLTSLIVYV